MNELTALNAQIRALHTEHDDTQAAWWDLPSCLSAEAQAIEARLEVIDRALTELERDRTALYLTLRERVTA